MTINKIQLDTIYWQLLELRGLTDSVDIKKLSSIDNSMATLAKELGYSTYTDEYIKGIFAFETNSRPLLVVK